MNKKMHSLTRHLTFFGLILCTVFAVRPEARSQNSMGIAAVVNEDVITLYDLNARLVLALSSSRMPNRADLRKKFAPQVLQQMIDDKLMLHEAKRMGISISGADIDSALDRIAARNGTNRKTLLARMEKGGMSPNTLRDQIRAQLAWSKVVQQMGAARVSVSDRDIDQVLSSLRGKKGDGAYDISAIYVSTPSPKQEPAVKQMVDRLHQQIVKGGDFAAIAGQFSQNAAAQSGGRMGWVTLDELEKPVARVVQNMAVGRLSNPIKGLSGYYIVMLHAKGEADPELLEGSGTEETVYRLRQIVFPFPRGANSSTQQQIADQALRATRGLKDCHDLAAQASAIRGGQEINLGEVRHSALPPSVRGFIAQLADNQPSRPLVINNSATVVMVCGRKTIKGTNDQLRERIRKRLMSKRMELYARQHLQSLRRSAFVDVRL